jgi:hypothetical protein
MSCSNYPGPEQIDTRPINILVGVTAEVSWYRVAQHLFIYRILELRFPEFLWPRAVVLVSAAEYTQHACVLSLTHRFCSYSYPHAS